MRTLIPAVSLALLVACAAPSNGPKGPPPAVASALERAQAELAAGVPLDALVSLDEALALAPDSREAWSLRAQALQAASNQRGDTNFLEDAVEAWKRAAKLGAGPEAQFGASKAAREAGKVELALEFAKAGLAARAEPSKDELRIASEAFFSAYIERKQAEQPTQELFDATDGLLLRVTELAPTDAWAFGQLANLYQWEGRFDGACEALANALELDLDNEPLHSRFVALKGQVEGPESVLSFYESLALRKPEAALPQWFAAQLLFDTNVDNVATDETTAPQLERAWQHYAKCRELKPDYASACQGYEVLCRAGIGWAKFHAGDLDGAERAFRSMEEVFPGGLEWQLEGRLKSGVIGLQYVADKALRESAETGGVFELGALARAARIYAVLHAYRPTDADFANNCGFFHREWGVGSVFKAREYRAMAEGSLDPAVRELDLALAAQERARAAQILTACRDAYLAAAQLAPQDVRVVNDAALILVYHFPSRADEAEKLLLQCVANGAAQKEAGNLPALALDTLVEAWGDAHQNLGVLELMHRRNPAKAREWFQKTIAIGPLPRVPREWAQQVALPLCDAVAAGKPLDLELLDPRIELLE